MYFPIGSLIINEKCSTFPRSESGPIYHHIIILFCSSVWIHHPSSFSLPLRALFPNFPMSQFGYYLLFLAFCSPSVCFATISPSFSNFIRKTFGKEAERQIARRELGPNGSFGGGRSREKVAGLSAFSTSKKRPVVFVHGLAIVAGHLDETLRQFREKGGYPEAALFGTSYSCGTRSWLQDRMECSHVRQVRLLIRAVVRFTGSPQVDVIGYSLGVPIARKAILGGICVDTGHHLGPPLTRLVHTFIGVAGANRDAVHVCRLAPSSGPCKPLNGARCHSRFLDDINSRRGYEASSRIFTIRSANDGVLGVRDCDGHLVSAIDGQHGEIVIPGYSHQFVALGTGEQQVQLLASDP